MLIAVSHGKEYYVCVQNRRVWIFFKNQALWCLTFSRYLKLNNVAYIFYPLDCRHSAYICAFFLLEYTCWCRSIPEVTELKLIFKPSCHHTYLDLRIAGAFQRQILSWLFIITSVMPCICCVVCVCVCSEWLHVLSWCRLQIYWAHKETMLDVRMSCVLSKHLRT